jgi:Branched-chain amino acid transport system / permease component
MNEFALLLAATFNAGTPLAVAGLGLLINERAGVLNLGAEGVMLMAAVAGFAIAFHTQSDLLAMLGGAGVGAIFAALFGVLVIWLNTNQYATGLALSLLGAGLSAFVGTAYVGKKLVDKANLDVPYLADIPFVGPALFKQHPFVYFAVALTLASVWFLYSRPWLPGAFDSSVRRYGWRRFLRTCRCLLGRGVYPALGGRNDGRTGLDCTGLDDVCHLASNASLGWRLFVWRRHHVAIALAGHGGPGGQPTDGHAAVLGDDRRLSLDFQEPGMDSR